MNRTIRNTVISLSIAAVASIAIYQTYPVLWGTQSTPAQSYRTESVSIGDISNTVSATGTLAAVDDVVVGAQLSGQVIKVYADFNDSVEEGQLLAKLDPASFAAQVDQAQALADKSASDLKSQELRIERAKLDYQRSIRELNRAKELYAQKNVSEDSIDVLETTSRLLNIDWQQAIVERDILKATHDANNASLAQAKIQLERTDIRAPISGFVINRTIEAGQTVASSYNTPELFTIARDLSEMEIEAYIDESDIGLIKEGQQVSFGVDAFTGREFKGSVRQIRKAPQDNSGVVSYVVVIKTPNPRGMLLPGMTANLEVSIENVTDIQRVSNAAVRIASRYEVSNSNQQKGPLARLKYLNLTPEQERQIQQSMPNRDASGSHNADRQQRQMMSKRLAEVLTKEQRALQKQIRDGKIKMGPLLLLRNNQIETVYAQLGVADDKYTAIIHPDLSDEVVVTQYRGGN
ncbi:efflux RND transporter periplasmic adaptor subunit [Vibrio maritimus]|uniref:efflux RND transporter periplasmic adaptor subunit n=1 Tax=Vibrio maritimus TaxID=990268 RepID=UPI0040678262